MVVLNCLNLQKSSWNLNLKMGRAMRASVLNTTKEIRGQPKAKLDANSGGTCHVFYEEKEYFKVLSTGASGSVHPK